MKILLTGASGFVGSATAKALLRSGREVQQVVRKSTNSGQIAVGNLDGSTDWRRALEGCDVVMHLAARVHVMREETLDPLVAYRNVNAAGTINLANQAAQAGVRRLIFVSSIKVNGEQTVSGDSFKADDTPAPQDAYGVSKYEAEVGLSQIALETGMEIVVIRPPLVYGPGVKGNFASLMRIVQRGIPLPLGAVTHNSRSLVALDNLVDLLVTCIDHPAAVNQTFMVSDGEDLSTTDLMRRLAHVMGKPARLIPVPPALLQAGAALLCRGDMVQRLLGSLQIDISHTCQTLCWKPPVSVDEGLRRAVGKRP